MRLVMLLRYTTRAVLAVAVLGCSVGRSPRVAPPFAETDTVITDVVGHYTNALAEELRRVEGSRIEVTGDEIRIQWDNAAVFDYDSAMLKTAFRGKLDGLADVLARYGDTEIVVEGHTDGSGPDSYSQKLSERRAISLRDYLTDRGIAPSRITAVGYGNRSSGPGDDDVPVNGVIAIRIRPADEPKAREEEG
jgi:outer membrane protein OmpA-like peptidoglycan-associated protein